MLYLSFDIPDGTSLKDFLKDLSANGQVSNEAIHTLLRESNSSLFYIIQIKGPKNVSFRDLRINDINQILAGHDKTILGLLEFSPEDMIFGDPLLSTSRD